MALQIYHFKQVPLNGFLADGDAIDLPKSVGFSAFRQQLQSPGTIPADCG